MHQSEFTFEGMLDLIAESRRRLDDNVDDELSSRVREMQLLLLQLLDGLLDPPASVLADVGTPVQYAVYGRHAEPCLKRDFLDQKPVSHCDPPLQIDS